MAERGGLRRLSVRAGATLAAVGAFGLVLVVAALAVLVSQRASLRAEVAQATQARADAVARTLESSVAPSVLVRAAEGEVVQIVDADGVVRAASANLVGAPALGSGSRPMLLALHEGDRELFLLQHAAVREGELAGGDVAIGRSLGSVDASVALLGRSLAVGVPLLTAVAGLITWVLAGGALRPVERMRRRVEAISASTLGARVPEPGGHDEVARLAATMNGMLARLERAQVSQRRFVSDASHELKSPLAVLRQTAELARDYPATTSREDLVEATLAESERMQHLVEDLLLLARSDEAALAPDRETVDLGQVAGSVTRGRTGPVLDTTGLGPAPVRGDAALLARAVRNLVDNAARHARGRVWVACGVSDGEAWLTVEDDGAGIGPQDRSRVFERFTRLDEARARDDGGSGLGLAIVHDVVAAHRGTVRALASPHGGARFEVRLPAVRGRATPEAEGDDSAGGGRAVRGGGRVAGGEEREVRGGGRAAGGEGHEVGGGGLAAREEGHEMGGGGLAAREEGHEMGGGGRAAREEGCAAEAEDPFRNVQDGDSRPPGGSRHG